MSRLFKIQYHVTNEGQRQPTTFKMESLNENFFEKIIHLQYHSYRNNSFHSPNFKMTSIVFESALPKLKPSVYVTAQSVCHICYLCIRSVNENQ